MKIVLRSILTAVLIISLGACQPSNETTHLTGRTMGTTWSVKIVGSIADAEILQTEIERLLIQINQQFSTYQKDSEISTINASDAQKIEVSAEMTELLTISQQVSDLSEGAFDITVRPLVEVWGFGASGPSNGVPDADLIASILPIVGHHQIELCENCVIRPVGMTLDFSAIAKGFAVDKVAEHLQTVGLTRFMVEIGGEVRVSGLNANERAWQIGVELPDRYSRELLRVMPLRDLAMATSGDYRNFFEHEGQFYSHTIDPATGWPVTHPMASVTVLHQSAAWADALATAFSVLGPEQTLAIANEKNFPVLAIIRSEAGYEQKLSNAMTAYLENH